MRMVVETAAGSVRGDERKGILCFRGVPYARAPEGERRFLPPEPPVPWAGVREADEVGASAPQGQALPGPIGRWLGGGARRGEDCLSLNVWTPGLDDARRPVLVWIHGGAFVFGSGATFLYSGRRLAARGDAVVVTLNYRLGALGFLHLDLVRREAIGASNAGIRDQVAALRFVREHASVFGGDPDNVTIFGESAGAMSVGTLLGVPEARPLFRKAILQSGAAHNVSSPETARRVTERFLRNVALGPEASPRELAGLPVERVLAAQFQTMRELGVAHGTLPWQPAVDGSFLPKQPLEAVAAGELRGVPILAGTNRDEWKLFSAMDRRTRRMDPDALLRRMERILPGKDEDGVSFGRRAIELYRSGAGEASPGDVWDALQADRIFRYPAMRLLELQAEHTPDTYAYLFRWRPRVAPRRVGACHALEIPFVFGTLRHPWVRPVVGGSDATRRLARGMQEAWLSFARDGRPESDELPPWARYEPGRRTTVQLSRESRVEDAPDEARRAFWEPHLSRPGA